LAQQRGELIHGEWLRVVLETKQPVGKAEQQGNAITPLAGVRILRVLDQLERPAACRHVGIVAGIPAFVLVRRAIAL
jgi:hypothetical protein